MPGHWHTAQPKLSATFMHLVARVLARPVTVIDRVGRQYLDPARCYGARSTDGSLVRQRATPGAPVTISTFTLVPLCELLDMLLTDPFACSVVEFDGSRFHFDPWVYQCSAPLERRAPPRPAVPLPPRAGAPDEAVPASPNRLHERDCELASLL